MLNKKYTWIIISLLLTACGGSNSETRTGKITVAKLPDEVNPVTTLSKEDVDILRDLKLTAAPVNFSMPKSIVQ